MPTDQSFERRVLESRPIAFWPGQHGVAVVKDISGNGWNATITGAPKREVAPPPFLGGRGVEWSGTGQYALASTSFPWPTTAFTVMFWAQFASAAASFTMGRNASNQRSWYCNFSSNLFLMYLLQAVSGTYIVAGNAGPACNDGRWHSFFGTWDGTTLTADTDGRWLHAATSVTGTWHTDSTAAVALGGSGASNLFTGQTFGHALWHRHISAAERAWLRGN